MNHAHFGVLHLFLISSFISHVASDDVWIAHRPIVKVGLIIQLFSPSVTDFYWLVFLGQLMCNICGLLFNYVACFWCIFLKWGYVEHVMNAFQIHRY